MLRKLIEEERGQLSIDTNFHFSFYVTNVTVAEWTPPEGTRDGRTSRRDRPS